MSPKATPMLSLVGNLKGSKEIIRVPNILVIRKGVEKPMLRSFCEKHKYNLKKTQPILK